ncbi:MAG: M50 family metallopeptidase [Candidatus Baltobacteraceae bacterium]
MTPTLLLATWPFLDEISRIAVFLIMLSVLVVLHEGGHFLVARWNGVRVNDFAVGFGPTLLKWTSPRSGTNYRLNLLPVGGYCAMQGEDGKTSEAQQQRDFRASPEDGVAAVGADDNFQAKSPWRRLSIVAAGPIANFIVAFVILFVGTLAFGAMSSRVSTSIGPVLPGSPGARAGLELGDRIVSLNGNPIVDGGKMVAEIHASPGRPLRVGIEHHGTVRAVTIVPATKKGPDGKTVGQIGFSTMSLYERVGFGAAVIFATERFTELVVGNVQGLGGLLVHPHAALAQVSGPIGMARISSQAQDLGWGPYLQLAAAISIALGIFNFLPIPALDGGRGIFILAEMVRGRPVDPEKEALVHVTGFALLMVLMIFVAYHDIANIVSSKGAL